MRGTYQGNTIDALVDEELWPALVRAIRGARHEILLTQLLFEERFSPLDAPLTDELLAAAQRGARVGVLVNANAAIPDSFHELAARFDGSGVEVVGLRMGANVMHAKIVAIDSAEAFLVDAPFEQKYIDKRSHAFGSTKGRDKPYHSVSARVRGPIAAGLRAFAAKLFEAAGAPLPQRSEPPTDPQVRQAPPPLPSPPPSPPHAGRDAIDLLWTAPPGIVEDGHWHGIAEAYERAIERAKELVYIETQYLTSPRIIGALRAALVRAPRLEVILALNTNMDIPGYLMWQERRLEELGAWTHPRIGAFALWSPRRVEGERALRQLYVHSKLAIVDDAWATLGSANLDSMSLHDADEFALRLPPNVEVNLAVEGDFPTFLRRRLFAEHLADEGVWSSASPPTGGWLALWRKAAAENLRRYELGDMRRVGRIFHYRDVPKEAGD